MDFRRHLLIGPRSLRRMPGVAPLVVLTLGLAIGANATVFSVIDRLAMRPLPVEKPHELIMVSAPFLPAPHTGEGLMIDGGGRMMRMDYPLATALRNGPADMFRVVAVRHSWRCTLAADTSVEV